jgi:KUP system potassium uptake protein
VRGTSVFTASGTTEAPRLLIHTLEHEQVILVTVSTEDVPRVASADRADVEELAIGLHRIVLRYSSMQSPMCQWHCASASGSARASIPTPLSFFLGHEEIILARRKPPLQLLRTQLFAFLWRNAIRATAFYNIASARVVAIGLKIEL